MKKLPVGIQSIKKILSDNEYIYVDKTGFVKKLIEEGSPHYFLSRPRRFGKSLFLNTLEEVFNGNKELFKNCEIYGSDYKWGKHPIFRLDFAQIESGTPKKLEIDIKEKLQEIASAHKIPISGQSIKTQLRKLIPRLAKDTRVVVLVDEYDHPIINHLNDPKIAEKNRDILKSFFETFKSFDDYIQFTFITGVSKFSQVSLFSGLNNLKDITFDSRYAGMMGYTQEELKSYFSDHIESIIQNRKEKGTPTTKNDVLDEIRTWYNGYRFSSSETCVYNPFSTLNYMDEKEVKAYWYSSGTPSFLIEEIKKHPKSMVPLDGSIAREDELTDISSLEKIDLKALMYQTGYFTIQDYNPISKRYHLGLPNEEVRTAFMNSLVKNFTKNIDVRSSEKFIKALENHQLNVLFEEIKIGFASFAYQVFAGAKEKTYQAMILSMLYGMGFEPLSERSTNIGRIDVVLEMQKSTYIIELKLDKNSKSALDQIRKNEYFMPYLRKGKEIVIVGANFSSEKRNVSEWEGEILSEDGNFLRNLKIE
ncbi:MAG: AAA family ATPase [Bacteroidetes bacterium]|nr:AAA family ATPase [Bacteroidota bacterium]